MARTILAAVLALALFGACGDEPTGPTTTGGEVTLEITYDYGSGGLTRGAGYNFVRKLGVDIMGSRINELGRISDMDLWPESGQKYGVYAKPKRIYLKGKCFDRLCFHKGEAIEFKLRAREDNARCEVAIENVYYEYFPEKRISVSKFVMRYKMEIY